MLQNITNQSEFISIIIPVYNTEKYLRQCVDSVLSQSFTDFELLLVDDGSSDGCIDMIKEYASLDSRVQAAFIKGTGPAMPRNYGLDHARGQYVLFLDSDDYLVVDALESFAKIIEEHPDIDFIKGNQYILMDDNKEHESVFKSWRQQYAGMILGGEDFMVSVLNTDFTPTNSLFKRKLLEDNQLRFHEELRLLEDLPFMIELCSLSRKCVFNPKETYVYRLFSETSLTRSKRTLSKVMSLANVAEFEKELVVRFGVQGRELVLKRYTEHSVTALFQACTELRRDESLKVLGKLKTTSLRLPRLGRDIRHKIGVALYNLSPRLVHDMLRILSKVIKNI